ncbi:MAG TPA: hypothetical protein VH591_22730 [Ktedonobacterales bacterium]|jgi:hypothetical protein
MWFQIVSIALGIWLLVAPGVLPSTEPGAAIARIAGPLAILIGVLAVRSVTRPVRALNVLNGMFLAIVPWLVPNTGALLLTGVLVGWAIIVLSIPRGAVRQETGGGWWTIVHPEMITHVPED